MVTKRQTTPKSIRDAVLREYSHMCAICSKERPQVHHIDEDPNNNEPLNLLPLCANHHLSDQHNPTVKVDPRRLSLFRRYKDPQILSPQFSPIFNRIVFLLLPRPSMSYDELLAKAVDLARFVGSMSMGTYYEKAVSELLDWSFPAAYNLNAIDTYFEKRDAAFRLKVEDNSDRVVHLVVEQLRYQSWAPYGG